MAEQRIRAYPDAELIDALRALAPQIAWPDATPPAGGPDLASGVRARIDAIPPIGLRPTVRSGRWWLPAGARIPRSARRALLIAVVLLVALAALAGAAGLGLPGLRLLFGGGSVSPPPSLEPNRSPSPGDPGAAMNLGDPVSLSDAAAIDARAGFHVRWPADPRIGQPDAAYIDETKRGQVSLVWAARGDLPSHA